jgi:hypothetical protein
MTRDDDFRDVPVAEPDPDPFDADRLTGRGAISRARRATVLGLVLVSQRVAWLAARLLPRRHPYRTFIEGGIETQKAVLDLERDGTARQRVITGATRLLVGAAATGLLFASYLFLAGIGELAETFLVD